MASIGFVVHRQRAGAVSLAEEAAVWLRAEGHSVRFLDPTDGRPTEQSQPLDLAVSLGGDGTMLRTVDLVSASGVPVLGVNLGRLGYLTACEPGGLQDALKRFLTGDYLVEPRTTLDVSVTDERDGGARTVLHRSALNDVVLQRDLPGRTMRTHVSVNGVSFLDFASDSLILSTPTGSTAYNLSARGPIVSPRAHVLVLTPVAPHMLFDRSMVLDAEAVVSMIPIGELGASVVVDGWLAATLEPGQMVVARRGDLDARLVTFGERNFEAILKSKFNLGDS